MKIKRKLKPTSGFFLLMLLFASCFSYRSSYSRKSSNAFDKTPEQKAFVINQSEFPREYKILSQSGLYTLTQDTTSELRIKLHKMTNNIRGLCITGQMTVLAVTLGQYPVTFPENYTFAYEQIRNKEHEIIQHQIEFEKRVWFWDLLSMKKSRNKVIASGLRQEKLSERSSLKGDSQLQGDRY